MTDRTSATDSCDSSTNLLEAYIRERGLDVSYETVRRWFLKLGPTVATNLRRSRPTPSNQLFILWAGEPYRATRDLDLLGFGERDIEALAETFRALCNTPVEEDDGLEFIAEPVQVEPMRDEEGYPGARLRLEARLAGARLSIQVDIGFGDAVTPKAEEIEYPSLLALPAPRIRAYPRETVVAEKYEAIVSLGMLNSRVKDFYDLWVLASSFPFDGQTLVAAVRATFDRRGTALPEVTPVGLSDEFAGDRRSLPTRRVSASTMSLGTRLRSWSQGSGSSRPAFSTVPGFQSSRFAQRSSAGPANVNSATAKYMSSARAIAAVLSSSTRNPRICLRTP